MMKTTFFVLAMAGMSAMYSHAQSSITQLTDAAHSQGYISWVEAQTTSRNVNISYTIVFYDLGDPRTTLLSFSTTSNFLKVDPSVFQVPNLAYRIDAYNNSELIASSEPVANYNIIEDPYEIIDKCSKQCNGTSYAYEIHATQKKVFTGGLNSSGEPNFVLENIRLFPQPTSAYVNPTTGVYVPFYQAMDGGVYGNLPFTHPYKVNSDHLYDKVVLPLNHQGVILDATNTPVSSGWYIPKRMDQFGIFNGPGTDVNASPGEEICSAPMDGLGLSWVNFYNEYHDYVSFPTTNNFGGLPVSELECHEAFEYEAPEGGEGGDDEGDGSDEWFDDIEMDFAKELAELSGAGGSGGTITWGSVLHSLGSLSKAAGPNGDFVTNVVFTNVHNPSLTANLYRRDNKSDFDVDGEPTLLSKGLYTATAITQKGIVFPYYMGLTFSESPEALSETVTLTVAPNPATDGLLRYSVNSTKSTTARYFVNTVDGTELVTGSFTLEPETTLNFSFDVKKTNASVQQVILSILLSDGSVVQELVQMAP